MSFLTAVPGQDPVYEIQDTDDSQGGPGQLMNFQAQALLNRWQYLFNEVNGRWVDASGTTLGHAAVGGGTWTIGTIQTHTYKQLGNTMIWQLQLLNCTLSSTPSFLRLNPPYLAAGGGFINDGAKLHVGSYDTGGASSSLFGKLGNPSGFPVLDLFTNAGWSAGSGINIYVNITCEYN